MRHIEQNMEITVSVQELINHLKANKENHIKDFQEAREIYLTKVTEHLTTALESAKSGVFHKNNFNHNMHQPIDKSAEYDKYIGMLNMAQETDMKISTYQYDCFVNDEWEWVSQSKSISAIYKSMQK